MRVIFDCFKQVKGTGKSIGIYNVALNLISNLRASSKATDFEYIVLGNKYNREDFDIDGVKFVEIEKDPLNKLYCIYWELFGVTSIYKKLKGDVIVFPRGYTTFFHNVNDVIIVHDLIPFFYKEHYPYEFNKLENAYIMKRLKASIKKANKIVTISEASKENIIKIANVDEKKITVIHNGLNRINAVPMRHEDYIVAMTSGLPHKNAVGIVKSYAIYAKKNPDALPIKIIGIPDVEKYGLDASVSDKVTCYKFIKSNDEMHEIIGKAKMFVFLSEVEGFGFPPIEAMELGVPVICSSYSSLPEVVGDAAIQVDPHDYKAVSDALSMLQNNESLQIALVNKGCENIKRFGWDQILSKYEELLSSK